METKKREEEVLKNYILKGNLKSSHQRKNILDVFLNIDRHLTAEELYLEVKKGYPFIGFATVYRALKLFCECGLCRELNIGDGITRYEHLYRHQHHDHLICIKCGRFVEIIEPGIEKLQEKIFKKYGFQPQKHCLELYGICKKCRNI